MNTGFVTYTTHGIASHRKVEFWDEHASDVITSLHVEPARETVFEASLKAAEFGGIGFIQAGSTPTRVVHANGPATRQSGAAYLVHMQFKGTCVNRQANTEVVLGPGDFVLCDNTLPCELLLSGANDMLVTPSCSISRSTLAGSKRRTITWRRPIIVQACGRPHPLAWKSGMVCNSTAVSLFTKTAMTYKQCKYKVRCESITPLGVPVEPEV